MSAIIIALEGIDQSGKRTQTRLLAKRLKLLGFTVRTISFPIYGTPSGKLIRRYLNGERAYSPQSLHMLYSLNRWENYQIIEDLLETTDFLIADRYTPSNLAYGISKGLDLKWLKELDRGLPDADLVIVLDVAVSRSFSRKSKKRDVHERSTQLLSKVKTSYRKLAGKLGWKMVDAPGSVQEVELQVWKIVRDKFSLSSRRFRKSTSK